MEIKTQDLPGGAWYGKGHRGSTRHLMLSVVMIIEAVEGDVHINILRWRPNQGRLPGGGNYWDNVE